MESKSFGAVLLPAGAARIVGFGWFFYLVLTSLIVGFGVVVGAYGPALLISLVFPRFRRVADTILQKAIALLMAIQPWLKFDSFDFARVYDALRESFPPGGKTGLLIVSNHRSHLDTFLLLARVPGIRVLAKRGLFSVPLLGIMMWATRQIPVRRKDLKSFVEAMDVIGERLASGEVVHVFPEMTRGISGVPGVAPFNPAPFLVAMKVGAPIFPLAISGTGESWPKGSLTFRSAIPVRILPLAPIRPAELGKFASAIELAEYCRQEIGDEYRKSGDA